MRSSLRRVTLRTRLAALTSVAVGLTVAVAALVSFVVVRDQLDTQITNQLTNDLNVAQTAMVGDQFDPARAAAVVARFRQDVLQIVEPTGLYYPPASGTPQPFGATVAQGTVTISPSVADRAIAGTAPTANPPSVMTTRTVGSVTYRIETVGGTGLEAPDGSPLAIQVAHPITDVVHLLDQLRLVLLLTALAGMAVAVAAGLAVAKATIRPVERLTAAAEHVAATQDLGATIDDDGKDELSRLAHAFNAMLAALRSSRQQQAQLVSDAGHELRTPLTSLRTNIEVLLTVDRMPDDDKAELLGDVRGQLEELTTLIGDLVELGRQEETQPEPTEVRLDAVVGHAIERARRRAAGVSFDVSLEAGAVRAQPPLLERAVLNVLDNAAKFSPPGGTIEVRLHRGETWVLEVADHGPGIPDEDVPHVFDRFYRASTARSLPGSGLGLAIVAQVVAAHGGTVTLACPSTGGTVVRIELPIVAESESSSESGGGPADGDRPAAGPPPPLSSAHLFTDHPDIPGLDDPLDGPGGGWGDVPGAGPDTGLPPPPTGDHREVRDPPVGSRDDLADGGGGPAVGGHDAGQGLDRSGRP